MRKSKRLERLEKLFEGRRVIFHTRELPEVRGGEMVRTGPHTGTVFCICTNEADFDGSPDGRRAIRDTGALMVRPDRSSHDLHVKVDIADCEIEPSTVAVALESKVKRSLTTPRRPSTFKIGQELFCVLVDEFAGKCEMNTWEVRTIRGGRVTAILRNQWTWVKRSTKNGDWGWAERIDEVWRKTWNLNENPWGLSRSKKAAWQATLKSALEGRLYIDEAEVTEKVVITARRQITQSRQRSPKVSQGQPK